MSFHRDKNRNRKIENRKKSFDLFQEIPVEDIDERQRCIDDYLRQMKLEMLRKEDDS
jgi:hypothetical protein